MMTQFKTLFTVSVAHAYYSAKCEDIRFIIPSDTARLLNNGKVLAKDLGGRLHVLFEADEAGAARVPVPGKTLRFGLQLLNPFFSNFTDVAAGLASFALWYRNAAAPGALNASEKVKMVGQVLRHELTDSARPVTITLKDAAAQMLQTETIPAADNRSTVSYDLTGRAPGAYTVEEAYPASTKQNAYYSDPELLQTGVFGVLEVEIAGSFYAAATDFQIAFQAREETLKYYIAAKNYTDPEFGQLSVVDAGFTEEGRPEISFASVASSSFTASEIAPGLLGNGSAKVVLFKSKAPVARAEKARKKIQLKKKNEVLVTHLPQPGPEKANADMIIVLSKP